MDWEAAAAECAEKRRALKAENRRLRDGLGFYANEGNWDSRVLYTVPEGHANAGAQQCESGPAWDRGARARAALTERAEGSENR